EERDHRERADPGEERRLVRLRGLRPLALEADEEAYEERRRELGEDRIDVLARMREGRLDLGEERDRHNASLPRISDRGKDFGRESRAVGRSAARRVFTLRLHCAAPR